MGQSHANGKSRGGQAMGANRKIGSTRGITTGQVPARSPSLIASNDQVENNAALARTHSNPPAMIDSIVDVPVRGWIGAPPVHKGWRVALNGRSVLGPAGKFSEFVAASLFSSQYRIA